MLINFKKSLLSVIVCVVFFPLSVFATDDTITNSLENKTYSADTILNNLTITNSSSSDAHSIATVNNDSNLTITNDLNMSTTSTDNAYLIVEAGSSVDINNTNLGQQTYIYGDGGDVTISGLAHLEDNASIESNNSIININQTIISSTAYIAGYGDSNITVNQATLDDNSTIGTENGTVTTNGAVALDGNSSIYSQGNNIITTNGTVDINGTSNIFSNGGIVVNGVTHLDGESFLDANNSNLNINAVTSLDGNSSLYAMDTNGTITSTTNGIITLNDTSRVYTEHNDINLSGDLIANDYSIIMADNNASMTLNNVVLDNNATIVGNNNIITINGIASFKDNSLIYATGTGLVTLKGINTFDGKNSGIFIENNNTKDIYSKVNINLTNTTTLKNGAYIVNQGDGNVSINKLNIINSGFVIADNNISIKSVNISDSGDFDYVLINSKNGILNLLEDNITIPNSGNIISYIEEHNTTSLSVYKSYKESLNPNLYSKNTQNLYKSLVYTWYVNDENNVSNGKMLQDLNGMNDNQYNKALKTMNPNISNGNIGAIDIINGVISTIGGHLSVSRNSSKKGISTGDEALNTTAWVQGFGTKSEQDDVNGISGYDSTSGGIIIGIDKQVSSNMIYGIGLSFGVDNIRGKDIDSNANTNIIAKQISLYFSKSLEKSYVEGYFSKGINKNNSSRNIIIKDITRVATASYDSTITSLKIEYGRYIRYHDILFIPNSSITSSIVSTNEYTEKGADEYNNIVDIKDMSKFTAVVGIKISKQYDTVNKGIILPEMVFLYKKELGDNSSSAVSKFRDSLYTYEVNGLEIDDSSIVYGGSLKYTGLNRLTSYKFQVDKTKSEHYSSITSSITARFKF